MDFKYLEKTNHTAAILICMIIDHGCYAQVTLLLRCRGHTLPSDIEQRVNSYNRRMAGQPRTVSDHVMSCDINHVPLDNGVVL